jgi:hypothetical protein
VGDVETVRLLATDTDKTIFTDDQIAAFLALESGDVRLAAAQALDTIASSKAMIARKATIGGITIDTTAVSKDLRDRAAELRLQAEQRSGAEAGGISVVDYDPNAWAW